MKFRNLEATRYIIKEATGLDISYAYDDLVFPEHTAFIIQFDDTNDKNLFCYFRTDCDSKDKTKIYSELDRCASVDKFTIKEKGTFDLVQKEEEVEIHFNP